MKGLELGSLLGKLRRGQAQAAPATPPPAGDAGHGLIGGVLPIPPDPESFLGRRSLVDQLRELTADDLRQPGVLPTPVKGVMLVALLALTIFAGYYLDWQNQLDELATAETNEEKLKATYLDKKKQAVNLDAYRKQKAEAETTFGALLRQLPSKAEMEGLITDINQAGLGRGLRFQLFKPAPSETIKDFYAETPVTIEVTGSYHDFGAFASDVAQLPRVVVLDNLAVSKPARKGRAAPDEGELSMKVVARTYRYLDPEEVAAQRKSAKSTKKK